MIDTQVNLRIPLSLKRKLLNKVERFNKEFRMKNCPVRMGFFILNSSFIVKQNWFAKNEIEHRDTKAQNFNF